MKLNLRPVNPHSRDDALIFATPVSIQMAYPTGESKRRVLRLDFERRLMVQFCGSVDTSDAGLLA